MRKHCMRRLLSTCILAVCFASFANADKPLVGDQFKRVTSQSEIVNGGEYLVIHVSTNTTMSKFYNKYFLGTHNITLTNDIATVTGDDVESVVLESAEAKNTFYLKTSDGYICNVSTQNGGNAISLNEKVAQNAKATITATVDKDYTTISYPKITSKKYIQRYFAYNINSKNFNGCANEAYTYKILLYRKCNTNKVTLNESDDNSAVIEANNGKIANVTLGRTIQADAWNSFCVPFDIDLSSGQIAGENVAVKEYNYVADNTMYLKDAKYIVAGRAYFIKPTANNIVNPSFYGVIVKNADLEVSGSDGDYTLSGVYSPKTFNDEDCKTVLLLTGNGELKHPKAGSTIRGMRAYFTIQNPVEGTPQKVSFGGTETAIETICNTTTSSNKNIYNTLGVYVGNDLNSLPGGIYIVGGKKVVVADK